jgi:hypothetical protein
MAGPLIEYEMLFRQAIEQRIEFALRGLSVPEGELHEIALPSMRRVGRQRLR